MNAESTIGVISNSIIVYICRVNDGGVELLLMRREGSQEWGACHANVKYGEIYWQSAVNEIRKDTNHNPDRIYSANIIENNFCVKTGTIKFEPVFVAFFDYSQEVSSLDSSLETKWFSLNDVKAEVKTVDELKAITVINDKFFLRQPSDSQKVYPAHY
ncbi:hypothetical protein OAB00_02395 [Akkermansiaceae bacterium]|nr:hypothetical protein [Akkermansiaceae bacterium]